MNPHPLLKLENVSYAYGGNTALRDISLEAGAGEFIGIIGPNGSGKTTLLKIFGILLPPATGAVLLDGAEARAIKRRDIARQMAWVPRETPMAFSFRVSEVVMMGRHPHLSALALEGEEDHRAALAAMQTTNTLQFADRPFNDLSSGEKQRVLLAGAIAQRPTCMLLDEPTSALDIKYQMEILQTLTDMNRESGLTVILAIHDLHLASRFCRRLLVLKEGRIAADGSPEAVLTPQLLKQVYGIGVEIVQSTKTHGLVIVPENRS